MNININWKRIKWLSPVVAFNENTELIYGRYDYFDKDNFDNPHQVYNVEKESFESCFAVKKITEEMLFKYICHEKRS
jgi:hypothetical protein